MLRFSSSSSQAMAQLTEWTQKPRKEPLRSTHLTSMVNVRVFDAKPISFEFPAGCSVVKGGAEGAGIARKRKHGYMDYQREQVNQIPNKPLACIPTHVGAVSAKELDPEFQETRELDPDFQETKDADSSLAKTNLAENIPRKRKRRNEPKDWKELKSLADKEAQ